MGRMPRPTQTPKDEEFRLCLSKEEQDRIGSIFSLPYSHGRTYPL
jgi:hypothetical protein